MMNEQKHEGPGRGDQGLRNNILAFYGFYAKRTLEVQTSMSNIADLVAFVNKQAERLEKILADHPDDKKSPYAYKPLIRNFREVAYELAALEKVRSENEQLLEELTAFRAQAKRRERSSEELTPADIEGLPSEVLAQLSISDSDRQDYAIVKVIEDLGGTVSLDKLIVHLYKTSNEVHERGKLNARLYRMSQKGQLHSVQNRRGVYSVDPNVPAETKAPES